MLHKPYPVPFVVQKKKKHVCERAYQSECYYQRALEGVEVALVSDAAKVKAED